MLLPSNELAELSKRVDICLSGKTSPAGCDIRYRQLYWLMVFDTKGELRAGYRLSDALTAGKKLGLSVPESLVATVDRGMQTEHSLEELERRYIETRGSQAAYLAIRTKIDELAGIGQMRVAAFLQRAAADTDDPGLSHLRGILVDAAACDRQVINHAAFAALRRSIESFVDRHSTHPGSRDVIAPLCDTAMKYTFDLSAQCEQYARTWPRDLAALLRKYRDETLLRDREKLARLEPGAYGALRLTARLGQAEATLAGLEAARTFGVMKPIHAEWRVQASAKVENR